MESQVHLENLNIIPGNRRKLSQSVINNKAHALSDVKNTLHTKGTHQQKYDLGCTPKVAITSSVKAIVPFAVFEDEDDIHDHVKCEKALAEGFEISECRIPEEVILMYTRMSNLLKPRRSLVDDHNNIQVYPDIELDCEVTFRDLHFDVNCDMSELEIVIPPFEEVS